VHKAVCASVDIWDRQHVHKCTRRDVQGCNTAREIFCRMAFVQLTDSPNQLQFCHSATVHKCRTKQTHMGIEGAGRYVRKGAQQRLGSELPDNFSGFENCAHCKSRPIAASSAVH
jgi:hypothetical protein